MICGSRSQVAEGVRRLFDNNIPENIYWNKLQLKCTVLTDYWGVPVDSGNLAILHSYAYVGGCVRGVQSVLPHGNCNCRPTLRVLPSCVSPMQRESHLCVWSNTGQHPRMGNAGRHHQWAHCVMTRGATPNLLVTRRAAMGAAALAAGVFDSNWVGLHGRNKDGVELRQVVLRYVHTQLDEPRG